LKELKLLTTSNNETSEIEEFEKRLKAKLELLKPEKKLSLKRIVIRKEEELICKERQDLSLFY